MSYDDTLPDDLSKARAWLGDTGDVELVTDDHIEAVLALYGSLGPAVAFLADELAVRFAQQPDSVRLPSGLSVSWSDRVKAWQALAANARRGVLSGGGGTLTQVPLSYGVTATDEFARPSCWWPS